MDLPLGARPFVSVHCSSRTQVLGSFEHSSWVHALPSRVFGMHANHSFPSPSSLASINRHKRCRNMGHLSKHNSSLVEGWKPFVGAKHAGLLGLLSAASPPVARAQSMDAVLSISHVLPAVVLADLDPSVARLLIGILGPVFTSLNFLFIIRIVMSWYPQLPVDRFPFVIAFAPTEPVLEPTRKLIPPVGGVDVSPVIWVAVISLSNEILLGQQGLLVLLSQQQM